MYLASQLIQELQDAIAECGDLEVITNSDQKIEDVYLHRSRKAFVLRPSAYSYVIPDNEPQSPWRKHK